MCGENSVYRGRFAPSPTGELHWGSLFNALASFLQARSQHGEWLIRIDDLDQQRCQQQSIDAILYTLERFGLHWDGAVYYQSQQSTHYHAALQVLANNNHLYACCCSRKQLKRYHSLNPDSPKYPGFCRNRAVDTNQQHALRVKTATNPINIVDPLQGTHSEPLNQTCGDFIVFRSDQVISYHLASVVDDLKMGINQAVRGHDLVQSSIQQSYLQDLLNHPAPNYVHLPIIVDASKTKLSKQTGAAPITYNPVAKTLFKLLKQLKQNPPANLIQESQETIITWAIDHWDIKELQGCTEISVDDA